MRKEEPSLANGPLGPPSEDFRLQASQSSVPQLPSPALGTKSSRTLFKAKNTASGERPKLALSQEEAVVDYADLPRAQEAPYAENTVATKESVKKTTIPFFSKRNLSQTRSHA